METQKSVLEHSTIKRAHKFVVLADKMQERLILYHENSNSYATLIDNGNHNRKVKINAWIADYESQRSIEFDLSIEMELAIKLLQALEFYLIDDYAEYLKTTKN